MTGIPSNATRGELERERADLTHKLGRATAEIEGIKAETAVRLKDAEAEAQRLRSALGEISAELARRETRDAIVPTISDHALLRYIERVFNVDIDAMKAELLTDTVVLAIKSGATGVKTPHGTLVIRGSTVVTFKSPEMDQRRRTPRDRGRGSDDQSEWEDA